MPFGLSDSVIVKINSVFEKNPQIKRVIIYGSRAKGNYKEGSDIDLCIKDSVLTMSNLISLSVQLDELMLPYEIDLSDYNKLTNDELVEHIERVGKVLWEKELSSTQ